MNQNKPIREWLQELPDGYRERALNNADKASYCLHPEVRSVADALYAAFSWKDTPEGDDWWCDVVKAIKYDTPLPPLPDATDQQESPFPEDAEERKKYPMFRGCIKYFPNALAAVAKCSYEGNQQHHPDKPLHWDMGKSTDEADALIRHLIEGEYDKVAWRALALAERHYTGKLEE